MAKIILVRPDGSVGAPIDHPEGAPLPALAASKGAWKFHVDSPPSINPALQTIAPGQATISGDTRTVGYVVANKSKAEVAAKKKADLAAFRYEREIAGTTATIGGQTVAIKTDRASQSKVDSMHRAVTNGTLASSMFKTDGGVVVTANGPIASAIYTAVVVHVDACHAKEADRILAIDALVADPAKTAADIEAYDYKAGW